IGPVDPRRDRTPVAELEAVVDAEVGSPVRYRCLVLAVEIRRGEVGVAHCTADGESGDWQDGELSLEAIDVGGADVHRCLVRQTLRIDFLFSNNAILVVAVERSDVEPYAAIPEFALQAELVSSQLFGTE